jgi:hypothetical protein
VLNLRWHSVRPPDRAIGGSEGDLERGVARLLELIGIYGDEADECLDSLRCLVHWFAV